MLTPSLRPLSAALLGLGLASVLLVACKGDPPKDPALMTAPELFQANCARCHGRAGEGSFLAPRLERIPERWDRKRLVRYMRDPAPVIAADPRLREQGMRYAGPMPAFQQLTPKMRGKLADWLLAGRP